MAVRSSGAVSLAVDIAGEFGGTAPHAMSEYYRGGSRVPDIGSNANIGASGRIRFGGFYSSINEILQALSSATGINLATTFGSDWATTVPKRATIASGVTIGGTTSAAAITIPSTMGGTLTIVISGSVIGIAGTANGGSGGDAISCSASGVTVNVESGGLLAGGGGGGGQGGTGGNGQYTSYTYYGHAWNGCGHTCFGYSTFYDRHGCECYATYCSDCRAVHNNVTSGGSGGAGGVGQGYNQTATSGSAGNSGGTNAGSGGTGGSGGSYGVAGTSGANGSNGNNSNGGAGSAGGSAGAAVSGTAVSHTNNGTVHGTVST